MIPFCDVFQSEAATPGNFRGKPTAGSKGLQGLQESSRETGPGNDVDIPFPEWIAAQLDQATSNTSGSEGIVTMHNGDRGSFDIFVPSTIPGVEVPEKPTVSQFVFSGHGMGKQDQWKGDVSINDSESDAINAANGQEVESDTPTASFNTFGAFDSHGYALKVTGQQDDATDEISKSSKNSTHSEHAGNQTDPTTVKSSLKAVVMDKLVEKEPLTSDEVHPLNINTSFTGAGDQANRGQTTSAATDALKATQFPALPENHNLTGKSAISVPGNGQHAVHPDSTTAFESANGNQTVVEANTMELGDRKGSQAATATASDSVPTNDQAKSVDIDLSAKVDVRTADKNHISDGDPSVPNSKGGEGRSVNHDAAKLDFSDRSPAIQERSSQIDAESTLNKRMSDAGSLQGAQERGYSKSVAGGKPDTGQTATIPFEIKPETAAGGASDPAGMAPAEVTTRLRQSTAPVQTIPAPQQEKPSGQQTATNSAPQPSYRPETLTTAAELTDASQLSEKKQPVVPNLAAVGENTNNKSVSAPTGMSAEGGKHETIQVLAQNHHRPLGQLRTQKAASVISPEKRTTSPNNSSVDLAEEQKSKPLRTSVRIDTDQSDFGKNAPVTRVSGVSIDPVQPNSSLQDGGRGVVNGTQLTSNGSQTVSHANDIARPDAAPVKAFETTVMDQIVSKASIRSLQGRSEIQIHLKPDFLGNVQMNVSGNKDQMVVRILTDQPMVKEIIETHVHQLKAELQNQGLTIDRFDVMVKSDTDQQPNRESFAQNMNQHSSQNGKRQPQAQNQESRNQNSHKEQKEEDVEQNGVNYFA